MGTNEHEAIKQIGDEVSATRVLMAELVADVRVLKAKLLGDDNTELPTGRIPQLEAEVERLKKRQDRHARFVWMASGFALCLNVIGWLASLASHISGVIKR
jgi:hypothetical protein